MNPVPQYAPSTPHPQASFTGRRHAAPAADPASRRVTGPADLQQDADPVTARPVPGNASGTTREAAAENAAARTTQGREAARQDGHPGQSAASSQQETSMDERLKTQLHRVRDTLNTYGDIVNETRAAAGLPRIGTLPGDDLDGIDPAELPSWHPFDMTDEEVLARIVSAGFLKVAQVVFERHQPVPLYLYPDGTYRDNPDPGTPPMFTLCVCSSCARRNDKGEWHRINWPCFEFQNLHSALCGDI